MVAVEVNLSSWGGKLEVNQIKDEESMKVEG